VDLHNQKSGDKVKFWLIIQVNRYYSEVNRVYLEEVRESLTTNSLSYKNWFLETYFGQVTDGEVDANGDGQIKDCCHQKR
jgi:hypothetical protein